MKISRRGFIGSMVSSTLAYPFANIQSHAAEIAPWHESIANKAKQLRTEQALTILIPNGSSANIKAAFNEFTRLSGVQCNIEEVAVDEINVELILRAATGENSVDLALPATFGITDLVQANAILALDELAERHEPEGFSDGFLYRKGDHYQGKLYGYQTDGDAYLMFYNKQMLEDPEAQKAYLQLTGNALGPASSWEEVDAMMAFFHRPEEDQYGGSLFRNPGYLVWEWWARLHAKGQLPFNEDMSANVNHADGVAALEELIAATQFLTPGSRANGLFENWEDFAKGNVFCNIGWGGTQKYLMSQSAMRDNLVHAPLPGPVIDGKASYMGYFNWGWDYTVSSRSTQPELAYLLALFCSTPQISTQAVRANGFFDPFHTDHFDDALIKQVYGESFLGAQRQSLENCIPDLYIKGQSNYLDSLRQQILATSNGELTAKESLDLCAQQWSHITRRLGRNKQAEQWNELLATYPQAMQDKFQ